MTISMHVITGFLGSGKTTLLKRLLADPQLHDSAVLINEFGEVGIDHLLVEEVSADTVLLSSGCVCCSVRGELKEALINLLERRRRGEIPAFSRVILETTGLASPAPILATLRLDPQLRGRFQLGQVITVVDALNALLQAEHHPEWLAQIAVADKLLLTKVGLVNDQQTQQLQTQLTAISHGTPQFITEQLVDPVKELFNYGLEGEDTANKVKDWQLYSAVNNLHTDKVKVCCLTIDEALNWTSFGVWLSMLLKCHGERILRVKGILNIGANAQPIAIHGVQHHLHAPIHLTQWPDSQDQSSRLVFIVCDLDTSLLQRSFKAFAKLMQAS